MERRDFLRLAGGTAALLLFGGCSRIDQQSDAAGATMAPTATMTPPSKAVIVNTDGLLANYVPVSQFAPGKSPDACSTFAVSLNHFATDPRIANTHPPAEVADWARSEFVAYYGPDTPSNPAVKNVTFAKQYQQVQSMLSDAGLAYQTIDAIAEGSYTGVTALDKNQSRKNQDWSQVKAAVLNGYPVIASISMSSVWDMEVGGNPYNQNTNGVTHIFSMSGLSADGNVLVVDPANVQPGTNEAVVRPWPRIYRAADLTIQWAIMVQMPWSLPIPNGNPASW